MTIKLSMPKPETELKPRITVVGVGGAGGNAVNNMIQAELEGVDFVVANTDAQALSQSQAGSTIQLGSTITQGLGAGSRPEIGRAAAEEALDDILQNLAGSHMVFVTAGMGGGTGTGAAPVIARAVREHDILTVGVVTKPFHFEGNHRMKTADEGIEELQQFVDTLIIIPNQNLFRVANEKTTFAEAFKMADNVLYSGVRGVTDLMVMPGLINLDFADVRTVMSEMGKAMMGTGEADGETRAIAAAEAAISNPLLDDITMKGARGVLINITGGPDMTLFEVDEAANRIREEVDSEANIVFGSTFDDAMEGLLRVSVVATGIEAESVASPRPLPSGLSTLTPKPARIEAPAAEEAAPAVRPAAQVETPPAVETAAEADIESVDESSEPEALLLEEVAEAPKAPIAEAAVAEPEVAAEPEAAAVAEPAPKRKVTAKSRVTMAKPAAEEPKLATPAPAAAAPEAPAPAKEESRLEPQPARRKPFIPKKAVMPEDNGEENEPGAFEAAAMENGTSEAPKARRRPSLFERMTGAGKSETAPRTAPKTREPASVSPMPKPEPAPAPAPEAAAETEPASEDERFQLSQAEQEMLDIPTFLRRQAN
ncbi:MAG: cell division protein FtsZ [Rhodospirillaceae bacterium]|nr:cell division protein FtsZ [Rhodospirillaceae bacterium]